MFFGFREPSEGNAPHHVLSAPGEMVVAVSFGGGATQWPNHLAPLKMRAREWKGRPRTGGYTDADLPNISADTVAYSTSTRDE